MIEFNHFNFNVLDLEKSIAFYKEAIGLSVVREKDSSDGSFKIVYLGDGRTGFNLELTWMRDRKEPYNLGDEEFHLAFKTDALMHSTRSMKRWAVSATKTLLWEFTLLMTLTDTGSKLFL